MKIDGELYELDDLPALDKKKKHSIEIVIDRLIVRNSDEFRTRLADSLETAAREAEGLVLVDLFDKGTMLFSQNYACPDCGVSIEELAPRMFSFNSPFGACPQCGGLGTVMHITPESIIPDQSLSFHQGAHAAPWRGTCRIGAAWPTPTLKRWPENTVSVWTRRFVICPRT